MFFTEGPGPPESPVDSAESKPLPNANFTFSLNSNKNWGAFYE